MKTNSLVCCHVIAPVIPHSDAGSIKHTYWVLLGPFSGFRIECGMTCGSLRGRVRGCFGGNTASVLWPFGIPYFYVETWKADTLVCRHVLTHVIPHSDAGSIMHPYWVLLWVFSWIPH